MKAMVYDEYGSPDNLALRDVDVPAVQDDQVLVKVYATSVNKYDRHFLAGTPFMARIMAGGLLKPKHNILGSDLAGRVEAVGRKVERLRPEEVYGSGRSGAFAEYAGLRAYELQLRPANITAEEAAAAGAAAFTALHGLQEAGRMGPGQSVLINGACGGVGTFAEQIAKAFGAYVSGVCSTRNLDLVRSTGADQVIDYTQDGFTQADQRYDLIFDIAAKRVFSECERVLNPQGTYATTAFSPGLALRGLWTSKTGDKRMVAQLGKPPARGDQEIMRDLLAAGKVTPVIDRRYALSEVREALRYLKDGHARGKVMIKVCDERL